MQHNLEKATTWMRITPPAGSLRNINPAAIHTAFAHAFPGLPITELLDRIWRDEAYRELRQIRNMLAHRVASAGRIAYYLNSSFSRPSFSVTAWASDLSLDATTTASQYDWLRETINSGVEEIAAFAEQQLAYTEDRLRQLAW